MPTTPNLNIPTPSDDDMLAAGADAMRKLAEGVDTALEWKTYTPVFSASGGGGAANDAVIKARYRAYNGVCDLLIMMKIGPGTTGGSGAWVWSLPALAPMNNGGHFTYCANRVSHDVYTGTGVAEIGVHNTTTPWMFNNGHQPFGAGVPVAFQNGDTIAVRGTYLL